MTDTEEDASSYTSASGGEAHYSSSDGGKQIVKKKSVTDKKPVLFHPGMLQDIMSEVSPALCIKIVLPSIHSVTVITSTYYSNHIFYRKIFGYGLSVDCRDDHAYTGYVRS